MGKLLKWTGYRLECLQHLARNLAASGCIFERPLNWNALLGRVKFPSKAASSAPMTCCAFSAGSNLLPFTIQMQSQVQVENILYSSSLDPTTFFKEWTNDFKLRTVCVRNKSLALEGKLFTNKSLGLLPFSSYEFLVFRLFLLLFLSTLHLLIFSWWYPCHDSDINACQWASCCSYHLSKEGIRQHYILPGQWIFRGPETVRSSRELLSGKCCLYKIQISPRIIEWKSLVCPDHWCSLWAGRGTVGNVERQGAQTVLGSTCPWTGACPHLSLFVSRKISLQNHWRNTEEMVKRRRNASSIFNLSFVQC